MFSSHKIKFQFLSSVGYFIEPTIVETSTTSDRIFKEEIFGPILSAYVYKDADTQVSDQI